MGGLQNFNSRTHVECDSIRRCDEGRVGISTHALTWSATPYYTLVKWSCGISTHALTWSATWADEFDVSELLISTHALTWSATGSYAHVQFSIRHFNSRTHVECDLNRFYLEHKHLHFNSRTHVECDQCGKQIVGGAKISTHALTWSATNINN